MLNRDSFNVHWKFGACQKWEPAGRIGHFSKTVLLKAHAYFVRFWILNECNLSWKIVKYCILPVWGLYDKNSASYYCFASDVMYKKYEMLVYTQPDLLAKFNLSKLVERKKFCLICFPSIRFPGLIYCDREPLWLLNVTEDDC